MAKSSRRKRIVRPRYTTKAIRIKQAPKKPVPRELKFGIIFCAAALVVAVILFFALYDDGSLPVENGAPVTQGDNWLVTNVGTTGEPRYYKVGEVQPAPGFRLGEDDINQAGLVVYTYYPEDAQSRIDNYYVAGINRERSVNAQSAHENYMVYSGTGGSMDVGEVQSLAITGHEVDYFTTATVLTENAQATQQMLCYLPAPRNTTVLISITVRISEDEPPLTEAELTPLLEDIIQSIALAEA